MRLTRHAVDADGFGFQCQAKIINQTSNPGILHSGIGLKFIGSHDRTGTDVLDLTGDIELAAFLSQAGRHVEQFIVGLLAASRSMSSTTADSAAGVTLPREGQSERLAVAAPAPAAAAAAFAVMVVALSETNAVASSAFSPGASERAIDVVTVTVCKCSWSSAELSIIPPCRRAAFSAARSAFACCLASERIWAGSTRACRQARIFRGILTSRSNRLLSAETIASYRRAKEKLVASNNPVAAIAIRRIVAPTLLSPVTRARAINSPDRPPGWKLEIGRA